MKVFYMLIFLINLKKYQKVKNSKVGRNLTQMQSHTDKIGWGSFLASKKAKIK